MLIHIRYIAIILLATALCFSSQQTIADDKPKEVKELIITEIQPGPRYSWPAGGSSGAGRWVVKDGKFGTREFGKGYYDADERPAMVIGKFDDLEETLQWSPNTRHVLIGKNELKGFTFDGDPEYPLTFKLIKDKGYVYLCGRGTVTDKSGKTVRIGYSDTIEKWLQLLDSDDSVLGEAAAQALGYLTKTQNDKDKVVPKLITATKSKHFAVRWNATEALGRIGDNKALNALEEIKSKKGFIGMLAEESIQKIKGESK